MLILVHYYGKTNFEVQRNFNANTTLVALFEIRFRSLFFDVDKRRQCSEVTEYFEIFYYRFVQERCFKAVSRFIYLFHLYFTSIITIQL